MALNIMNRVLTSYKADTKQHREELRKLSGEQKKAAKAQLEALEAQNAKLDKQIEFWGKVAVAVGGAYAAYKTLQTGIASYQEQSKLAAASAGADISGLRSATQGLISDTDLMRSAAMLMNGSFKLNNKEMQTAMKGALVLRKRFGVDLKEAFDEVTKAVTEGNIEGLKKYGIVLDAQSDSSQAVIKSLEYMGAEYRKLGGDVSLAGDEMLKANISLENSLHNASVEIGKMAVALAPLVARLAEFVRLAVEATSFIGDESSSGATSYSGSAADLKRRTLAAQGIKGNMSAPTSASAGKFFNPQQHMADRARREAEEQLARLQNFNDKKRIQDNYERSKAMEERLAKDKERIAKELAKNLEGNMTALGKYILGIAQDQKARQKFLGEIAERQRAEAAELRRQQAQVRKDAAGITNDAFGGMLGFSVEQYGNGADVIQARNMAMTASFSVLQTAVVGAYDAMVTGNDLTLKSFKAMVAGIVHSLGQQMLIEALKHTAMGIGALALGPIGGASATAHFKAAALFGAGAVAAGVVANQLGAGQNASAATGGIPLAGQSNAGRDRGAGGPQTTVILLDESYNDNNPRERQANVRRVLSRAGLVIEGQVSSRG